MSDDFQITDDVAARRWEIHVGGALAGLLNYRIFEGTITFTHIEIYPRFEGQGYAAALTRAALDQAIADGRRFLPACPYVEHFVADNPSYQEHIAAP